MPIQGFVRGKEKSEFKASVDVLNNNNMWDDYFLPGDNTRVLP